MQRRQEVKRAVNCCFLRFCYWRKEKTSCNRKVCKSKVPQEYKQRWSSLSVFESTEGLDEIWYPLQAPQPVKQLFQGPESINTFIHGSAGCQPHELKGHYSNINFVFFFPVKSMSNQQPLDLGIIQNFKVQYRKLLLHHVITMTTDHNCATDIAKTLDML